MSLTSHNQNLSDHFGIDNQIDDSQNFADDDIIQNSESIDMNSNFKLNNIKKKSYEDYLAARERLDKISEASLEIINYAKDLAMCTDSPRTIEAAAKLIQAATEAQVRMMELGQGAKNIQEDITKQVESAKQIQNNLFVGSTFELQKLLDKFNKPDA